MARLSLSRVPATALALGLLISCGVPDLKYEDTVGGAGSGATGGYASASGGAGGSSNGGTGALPDHCGNDETDEDETDQDCGGSCAPCPIGSDCQRDRDCESHECVEQVCTSPECVNEQLDSGETGTDCGGVCPKGCPPGDPCEIDADCANLVCTDDVCAEPTCGDHVQNGDETGTDCGGPDPSCPRCEVGEPCLADSDCVSDSCEDEYCALVCPENLADCDGDLDNECETNLLTDDEHCGTCENECSLPHATAECSGGSCIIATDDDDQPLCTAPWLDCNGEPEDGCEVNSEEDPDNCSACGVRCTDSNGTPSCENGECGSECDTGFADCEGDYRCETNLQTSVNSCGSCDKECSDEEGSPWCRDGECGFTICDEGLGDCDGDGECETDVTSSAANCGRCGSPCNPTDGTGACVEGVCEIESCRDGFGDCDEVYATGCEQSLTTPVHCGACNEPCALPGATASCQSGTCEFTGCVGSAGNCDGDEGNGCETDLTSTAAHCGTCDAACTGDHAITACADSTCEIDHCSSGYRDCNGFYNDGCEAELATDKTNCGSCGTKCLTTNATESECVAGTCNPACESPFDVCDAPPENGCTINTDTNADNCGSCGSSCAAQNAESCEGGECTGCVAGFGDCTASPGCETNLNTSASFCGGCDTACTDPHGTPACGAGACTSSCANGYGDCGGDYRCETNLNTSASHCGSCPNACTDDHGTVSCEDGDCASDCNTGWLDCSGDYKCETAFSTSNCGACGTTCSDANGTVRCTSGGACDSDCDTGWLDCSGNYRCETAYSTSNCGACGTTCSDPNGTVSCTAAGSCASSCSAGYLDCSGDYKCESPYSASHCGTCSNSCGSQNTSTASTCTAQGTCNISCLSTHDNCDGVDSNGCETDLTTSASHCGACNVPCSGTDRLCREAKCCPRIGGAHALFSGLSVTIAPGSCFRISPPGCNNDLNIQNSANDFAGRIVWDNGAPEITRTFPGAGGVMHLSASELQSAFTVFVTSGGSSTPRTMSEWINGAASGSCLDLND